jgi:Spy/CpxP family protein refolding chaperone
MRYANMRFVARLLAGGLLAALFAASALAQPGPRGQMPDLTVQLERLTERLGLSTEQADAIAPILAEQDAKRRELISAAREQGDRQGVRESLLALNADTDEKFNEHLTGEQMATLQTLRAERRERMRQQRGGRPPNP